MTVTEAFEALKSLAAANPALCEGLVLELAFGAAGTPIDEPDGTGTPGMLVKGDGIGSRSGLYFFSAADGEILYIGKATVGNLHDRVWDHVNTPKCTPHGRRFYPDHRFKGCTGAATAAIRDGSARLSVVTVSDAQVSSWLEVSLQTLFSKRHGRLPHLNKQIG